MSRKHSHREPRQPTVRHRPAVPVGGRKEQQSLVSTATQRVPEATGFRLWNMVVPREQIGTESES